MCEVLDKIENRGIEKGIELRIEKEKEMILNLSTYFSLDEISFYLKMPIEEIYSILQFE